MTWPWDVDAIERALSLYGMRPERVPMSPRVAFLPPFSVQAWCPGCYPGGGSSWMEDAPSTLTVGHVMGPWCRVCDLPAWTLLEPLRPFLEQPAPRKARSSRRPPRRAPRRLAA